MSFQFSIQARVCPVIPIYALSAAFSLRKYPRAFTARRKRALSESIAFVA